MVATARRIGWELQFPSTLRTDRGKVLDIELDPPIVIANEVKEAVRRWRWNRATLALPHLRPEAADVPNVDGNMCEILSFTFADSLAKALA